MKLVPLDYPATFVSLFFLSFSIISCDKMNTSNDSDQAIVYDNYRAQKEADDLLDAVNSAVIDYGLLRVDETTATLLPACAAVDFDTTASPKWLTITFSGPGNGCLCSDWDNKYRKGTIRATWTGKYKQAGTVITISTENYFVNGNKHEYIKTVTNQGVNGTGNLLYNVNVSLCKITYSDGIFNMTSRRTREFTEGQNTLTPYDDVYLITGSASGTTRSGQSFTWDITSPLKVMLGCLYVVQGTVAVQPSGDPERVVDFGNGTCDSNATVTINNVTYNLNL